MHLFTVAFCVGGVVEAGNPYNKMSKMFSSQGEVKIREPGWKHENQRDLWKCKYEPKLNCFFGGPPHVWLVEVGGVV